MKLEERDKIIREKALQYASEHNGIFSSACLTHTEKKCLFKKYESVQNFCETIGAKCKKKSVKKPPTTYRRHSEIKKPVLDGGTEVPYIKNGQMSICWDCKHSATTLDNACSWDRDSIIPDGATYARKISTNGRKDYELIKILSCPLFEKYEKQR